MDKLPKTETIEATLFEQRTDKSFITSLAEVSFRLAKECPEWERAIDNALETLVLAAQMGLGLKVCMSVCLANAFQAGVTAERARAECEQLQDAMNPRQLTEGRQEPHDCDTIT